MDNFALESFIDFCDSMEIVQEAVFGDEKMGINMLLSQDRKQAKGLMKAARKSYKEKDYAKAINLAKKSLAIWQSMKKEAGKLPDKQASSGRKYKDGSDSYKGVTKTNIIAGINGEISNIQAFIYKCQQAAKKR